MSRPKSKKDLLELSQANYTKLISLVNSYSPAELNSNFPEGYLNRNVKDVLGHIHHWHRLLLKWYETGAKGDKPNMPEKGYTWKTLPDLNKKIWMDYKDVSFTDIGEKLESSYNEVQKVIQKHTDEELFEKKKYNWTGSTSLAAYIISATSSHYDWAYKLIKKCKRKVLWLNNN